MGYHKIGSYEYKKCLSIKVQVWLETFTYIGQSALSQLYADALVQQMLLAVQGLFILCR